MSDLEKIVDRIVFQSLVGRLQTLVPHGEFRHYETVSIPRR